jgi:hypothetical protein
VARRTDPRPTRLDVTRQALRSFINSRHGDRLGMVVFSNYAYVVSPLTLDRDYLLRYLDIIDGQILRNEAMTAIGDGIDMGAFVLSKQSDRHRTKVIVVFTDGERNYGRDPLESLADANRADIRVHIIGVDLDEKIKERPAVQGLITAVRQRGGRYGPTTQRNCAPTPRSTRSKSLVISETHLANEPCITGLRWGSPLIRAALLLNAMPFFNEMT